MSGATSFVISNVDTALELSGLTVSARKFSLHVLAERYHGGDPVVGCHMDELVARRVPFSTSPLILVPFVLAGCATSHQEVSNQFRAPNSRGIIFAADGAGGFEATSVALRQAVQETGLPLQVDAVDWSHGYGRFLSDQMDWGHAKAEGQRLAARVAAFRQACPAGDVYLVGHSAGCGRASMRRIGRNRASLSESSWMRREKFLRRQDWIIRRAARHRRGGKRACSHRNGRRGFPSIPRTDSSNALAICNRV